MTLTFGFISKVESTVSVANSSPSHKIVSSSPTSKELIICSLRFPEGANIKGKGKDFPSMSPVFKTSWDSASFISFVTGVSNPSSTSSSAEAASLSI